MPSRPAIAREFANPNTPLARLSLRNHWTHWNGDLPGANGRNGGTFQFQPGFPFSVGERKNIFFRPAVSYVVDQPIVDSRTGHVRRKSGFDDLGFELAYGYATQSGWQAVVGMVGSFPRGTSGLSSRTRTFGPEVAVAKLNKWGVYGVFPNHAWNVSGPRNISVTTIQPILVIVLGGGWTPGDRQHY